MTKEELKRSILDQLQEHPAFVVDLVDKYLFLWDTSAALEKNIADHGVMLEYQNGANQRGFKKNDSIAELTKVNTQMINILKQLGIKAPEKVQIEQGPNLDLLG